MDIVVPEVGESIFEATIAKWNVADGDTVNKDDLICELETDKISLELNAESSGTIRLLAKEGETVKIGATIASLESGSEDAKPAAAAEPEPTTGWPHQRLRPNRNLRSPHQPRYQRRQQPNRSRRQSRSRTTNAPAGMR